MFSFSLATSAQAGARDEQRSGGQDCLFLGNGDEFMRA